MISLYITYPKWITPFVFPFTTLFRWYSLMYVFAFVTAWLLLRYILKHDNCRLKLDISKSEDIDLVVCVAVFLLLGARLGSALIYSGSYYWKHPHLIFWPFQNGQFVGLPGMSYHGGVVGAIIGAVVFAKRRHKSLLDIMDALICCVPFAYTWGRLGNFFNAELYGRVTSSGIGMLFPPYSTQQFDTSLLWVQEIMQKCSISATGPYVNLPRHPSQLYEALFEGIVVGLILWLLVRPRMKRIAPGVTSGLYFVLYGTVRFFIEYFREPDMNIGFVIKGSYGADNISLFTSVLNISMGQILCFLMIVGGFIMIIVCKKLAKKEKRSARRK